MEQKNKKLQHEALRQKAEDLLKKGNSKTYNPDYEADNMKLIH